DFYAFEASAEADSYVRQICDAVSLEKNFVVKSSNVQNALATMAAGKRVILYSTNFLEKFKADANTRWAAYSVLAHEIGHHLNGHDFDETNPTKRKMMELQADRFSGGALRLLGASLEEAKAGIETFAGEQETQTHPPRSARREAIASGWKKQDDRLNAMGVAQPEVPSPLSDIDQDGIPDNEDKCPDKKGTASNQGCPQLPQNLILVKGGIFQMGDVFGDGYDNEKPVHAVQVADFYLGKTEVTFDEYDLYCQANGIDHPWDEGWGRGKNPVINVSWIDAARYCNWLSSEYGLQPVYEIDGKAAHANWLASGFRLPTEAEWEYAARAVQTPSGDVQGGGSVRFGNGDNRADPYAINFNGNAQFKAAYSDAGPERSKILPVASFKANSLGIFDLSGNVEEWCWDYYAPYSSMQENNPKGAVSGFTHIQRGGSWQAGPAGVRITARNWGGPEQKSTSCGFRIARNAD
ncbi:MAG: hypothetical protein EP344_10210, partial [Bacteroidetes bacterium]